MVKAPSSTSSSRRKAGPPWGLASALSLLLLLEVALRGLNPAGRIAVGSEESDLGYRSVPFELEAGVPDVLVVGSSRARRGVLSPALSQALAAANRPSSVKNFALAGAEAEEVELVVRRIAEAKQHPKLIVWALSARELESRDERPSSHVRYLWRPQDWRRARRDVGGQADRYLPHAVRNEAARWSYIARYRFELREVLQESPRNLTWQRLSRIIAPEREPSTPMQGGMPSIFRKSDRNEAKSVSRARVKRYLGKAYREQGWPRIYQAEHLQAAVRSAQSAGIPILLVEVPVHEMLERAMPRGTQQRFRKYLQEVEDRYQVPVVSVEELPERFEPEDFREQSHLNYRGAVKYTRAVAPLVVQALGGVPSPSRATSDR